MPSAIPSVAEKAIEILEAAQAEVEALQGVAITADKEPELDDEYVWLYRKRATRGFKLVGPQPAPLDETLRLYFRILVVKGEKEAKPAEDRALQIAAAVEAVFREAGKEKALGKSVRNILVTELDDEPLLFDKKRGCQILMTVAMIARI